MFIIYDFIVYAPYYRNLYKLINRLIIKLEISLVLAYLLVVIYTYRLFLFYTIYKGSINCLLVKSITYKNSRRVYKIFSWPWSL
jgi:hypothetical protein